MKLRHGQARVTTGAYRSWVSAKQRCFNPRNHKFPDYGARGITMCEEWKNSFEAFYRDMGPRPPQTTLDRFPNPAGNYEPGNCRWANVFEQRRNRSRDKNDITGWRFGRLLVLERAPRPIAARTRRAYWLCRCDCGTEKAVNAESMRNGDTQSCGCYKRECDRNLRRLQNGTCI